MVSDCIVLTCKRRTNEAFFCYQAGKIASCHCLPSLGFLLFHEKNDCLIPSATFLQRFDPLLVWHVYRCSKSLDPCNSSLWTNQNQRSFPPFPFFSYAPFLILLLISVAPYKHQFHFSVPNLPPDRWGLPFTAKPWNFSRINARKRRSEKFICDRMATFSSQAFKTLLFGEPTVVLGCALGNENKPVSHSLVA